MTLVEDESQMLLEQMEGAQYCSLLMLSKATFFFCAQFSLRPWIETQLSDEIIGSLSPL